MRVEAMRLLIMCSTMQVEAMQLLMRLVVLLLQMAMRVAAMRDCVGIPRGRGRPSAQWGCPAVCLQPQPTQLLVQAAGRQCSWAGCLAGGGGMQCKWAGWMGLPSAWGENRRHRLPRSGPLPPSPVHGASAPVPSLRLTAGSPRSRQLRESSRRPADDAAPEWCPVPGMLLWHCNRRDQDKRRLQARLLPAGGAAP